MKRVKPQVTCHGVDSNEVGGQPCTGERPELTTKTGDDMILSAVNGLTVRMEPTVREGDYIQCQSESIISPVNSDGI